MLILVLCRAGCGMLGERKVVWYWETYPRFLYQFSAWTIRSENRRSMLHNYVCIKNQQVPEASKCAAQYKVY
jgi:hypothetical protein